MGRSERRLDSAIGSAHWVVVDVRRKVKGAMAWDHNRGWLERTLGLGVVIRSRQIAMLRATGHNDRKVVCRRILGGVVHGVSCWAILRGFMSRNGNRSGGSRACLDFQARVGNLRGNIIQPKRCGKRRCGGRIAGRVFSNDLLQGVGKDLPGKHLDVLFDVSGLWGWEPHDDLEEIFALSLGLGNGQGAEAFQVSADAVLLFHGESDADERFEEIDCVDTGDEAFVLSGPIDAADANAIGGPVCRCDGLEIGMDSAAILTTSEMNKSSLTLLFISRPVSNHRIQIAIKLENSLGWVHGIWIEWLLRRSTAASKSLLDSRGSHKSRVWRVGGSRSFRLLRDGDGRQARAACGDSCGRGRWAPRRRKGRRSLCSSLSQSQMRFKLARSGHLLILSGKSTHRGRGGQVWRIRRCRQAITVRRDRGVFMDAKML